MQWRFSYGRKCFLGKLSKVEIEIPTFVERGEIQIDESQIELLLEGVLLDRRPPVQHENNRITSIQCEWARKRLTDIFRLERGSFHSLKSLNTGCFPTVSRTESDNGVVGFYEPPKRSKHYPPGSITVSTVSGDAFVQVEEFIATDNVVMLIPIGQMDLVTTYFLASAINHQKWRYSYGRQCYIQKLSQLVVDLPWKDGRMDECATKEIVEQQPYWPYIRDHLIRCQPRDSHAKEI